MIDQSLEMTRNQRFKFNMAVFVCMSLFGFGLLDVFMPEWPAQMAPMYDKVTAFAAEQLKSWGFLSR